MKIEYDLSFGMKPRCWHWVTDVLSLSSGLRLNRLVNTNDLITLISRPPTEYTAPHTHSSHYMTPAVKSFPLARSRQLCARDWTPRRGRPLSGHSSVPLYYRRRWWQRRKSWHAVCSVRRNVKTTKHEFKTCISLTWTLVSLFKENVNKSLPCPN